MLDNIDTGIKIIIGIFAIITGLYSFSAWLSKKIKKRKSKRISNIDNLPPLDPITVSSLFSLQERELSVWRLLGFRRDIKMMDVHVQEILEVATPAGKTKAASPPFLAEEIHKQIIEAVDPDKRFIVIEGNSGSGKSTMLKHWALLLAKRRATSQCPIPIYLSLRHLKTLNDSQETIGSENLFRCFLNTIPLLTKELAIIPFERLDILRKAYITPSQDKIVNTIVSISSILTKAWPISYIARPVSGWLLTYQQKRRKISPEWIFLCDGLDEMPREFVGSFVSWVRGLPLKVCAVIATRPGMDHVTNLPQSRHFNICNFNDEQVSIFVRQWFNSNKDLGNRFLQEIHSNIAVREIVGIPLLLTFLSLEVEVSGIPAFPKDLTQSRLLLEITEILLEKWEATKRSLPLDNKMTQLGMLVFERVAVHFSYGTAASYEQLEKITNDCISHLDMSIDYRDRFLSRIEVGAQVMQGNREIGYFFIHKIFFDFFFSRYIIRTAQSEMGKQ